MTLDAACVLLKEIVIGKRGNATLYAKTPNNCAILMGVQSNSDGVLNEIIRMAEGRGCKIAHIVSLDEIQIL